MRWAALLFGVPLFAACTMVPEGPGNGEKSSGEQFFSFTLSPDNPFERFELECDPYWASTCDVSLRITPVLSRPWLAEQQEAGRVHMRIAHIAFIDAFYVEQDAYLVVEEETGRFSELWEDQWFSQPAGRYILSVELPRDSSDFTTMDYYLDVNVW